MKSKYAFALLLSAAVLTSTNTGHAASKKIKGQYAFSGSAECIVSGTPFSDNFTPTSFSTHMSFNIIGVRTFNGDGTGTIRGRNVTINLPPVTNTSTTPPTTPLGGIGASAGDVSASFTYTIDDFGYIHIDIVPGTFIGTTVSGPGAGSTNTLDHVQFGGIVSADHKTIHLASIDPIMETQVITPVSGPQFTRYRICHRARVLTWIGE